MPTRAWRAWGILTVLAGGLVAADPPVEGRATPTVTQDFHQPESAPPPRVLPAQILKPRPAGPELPTVESAAGFEDPVADRKGRMALQIADIYYDACELDDARTWYRQVIKIAPGTRWAASAASKLSNATIIPAGESAEPPLADATRIH